MQAAFPKPVAVAVAPNGGRLTKDDHPGVPLGAAELAATAARCSDAGASLIHIHVRDANGRHLLDAEAYREVTTAIRSEVGDKLVVQVTSEALGIYTPEQQRCVIRSTRPEAASLALRELVPDASEEAEFAGLLSWMKKEQVLPQIILYSPDDAARLAGLIKRGLVPWDDIPVLYVLGRYTAGQTSQPSDLLAFLAPGTPRFSHWSVCAFGRHETACVTASALLGGHVRVGFENNRLLPDGTVAADNAQLVEATATAIRANGLQLADADSWRNAGNFDQAVALRDT